MFWLLEMIIKFIYTRIFIKQISDKPINVAYKWSICNLCRTQLNDRILRYDDNSFCISCHEEISMRSSS